MKKIKLLAIAFIALLFTSCGSDYLEPNDTAYLDSETAGEVGSNNPDAFLNGIWSYMVQYNNSHDDFGYMSIMLASDMTGQDIAPTSFHWFCYDYDFDNRLETYRRTRMHWTILYTMIDKANQILSTNPTNGGLKGNALAVRGLAYTLLIQIFQNPVGADGNINRSLPGVPLIYTDGDVDKESLQGKTADDFMGRNTVGEVLDQAKLDLTRAVTELEESEYTRPNKDFIDASVANGLLARYYLLVQDWDNAYACAKKAKEGYQLMSKKDLTAGFMDISNSEWMWGFDESTETATAYASFFSQISSYGAGYGNGYCTKCIDADLYSKIDANDYRLNWFTGPDGDGSTAANLPYANKKFGSDGQRTEDYMYMRVAEMYLIMAECDAHKGNETQAADDIRDLMNARYSTEWKNTKISLEGVLVQRRIELWGEGFGFFDLKRLNRGINRNYDGSNHLTGYKHVIAAQDKRWVYQIPQKEIQNNEHITEDDQNE